MDISNYSYLDKELNWGGGRSKKEFMRTDSEGKAPSWVAPKQIDFA